MRGLLALLALCIAAGSARGQLSTAPTDEFLGTWQGMMGSPGAQMHLGLAVAREPTGALRALLTSGDQPGMAIPSTVSVHGDTIVVDVEVVQSSYRAVARGDSLLGTFSHADQSLTLDMVRTGPLASPHHGGEPEPPFPYPTKDVSFHGAPGVQLAGTLTLPSGPGPFPAVVLVPGSGAEDRNETSLGRHPFLVLADYLARHGIASLRYDDRGVGQSTGTYASATSADLAVDADSALHFLEHQTGVARGKVGIVGHSEGGMIGTMVAARSSDVAFLVLLAAPGLPGDSVVMLQKHALFVNNGLDPIEMGSAMRFSRQVYDIAKSDLDSAAATAKIQAITREYIASLPDSDQTLAQQDGLEQSASTVTGPWFRYLLRYDPRRALRAIHVPVLAVGGTLDDQITPENLASIDTTLKDAGNRDYKVVSIPNLNHALQTTVAATTGGMAPLDETISPVVLSLVSSWITDHTMPH